MALLLNGMGLGSFRIQVVLKHMNVDVHVDTIARWLEYYVGLVEKYTSPIQPSNLGSGLGADEKRRDVKGKENYFVMAMRIDTRFIPAWCTAACKQSHDTTKLPKAAVAKAGKPYPILITDGLDGHHATFKNVFGSLKGFFMHIRGIHIRHEFTNTNKQERVNWTFAGHTDPARGINARTRQSAASSCCTTTDPMRNTPENIKIVVNLAANSREIIPMWPNYSIQTCDPSSGIPLQA